MKAKRIIALILSLACLLSSSLTVSAANTTTQNEYAIDITHIAPENRDAFIAEYVAAYIEDNSSPLTRGDDRYCTYHTEDFYKTGYISDFADHTYPNGYVLDGNSTDGLFWFDDVKSTEHSGSVTFTVPYKTITITATLGTAVKSTSGGGVFKLATSGPGNYKIWVTKSVQVRQVVIYQTDTRTNKTTLWDEMYFQEILDADPDLVKL